VTAKTEATRVRYIYLGDRLTDPRFVGQPCDPVHDARGKCVVRGGKALVVFSWGERVVVLRRRLRLESKLQRLLTATKT
jgi:hypothetical protein